MNDRKICPKCDWGHYSVSDVCDHCLKQTTKAQVILTFDSVDQKNHFMGQLSDGWGENFVGLKPLNGKSFYEADEFCVHLYDVDFDGSENDLDEDTE